ncbi:MAG TPA: Uma2 family endonuclease [Kofleriaceae bacterium]|jgi:Uma2 family endonuclease|nr:Uma2 family endonuclease [Kofleriaceae bacterium]
MMQPTRRGSTFDDFWAIPEQDRFHELIAGEIVRKAAPSGEHDGSQGGILISLGAPFQRASGGRGGPGGWWFGPEVEILLGLDVVRPDIAGWRRDRCPERPAGMPVKQRPDWVCEVVSPGNARHDTVTKRQLYHRAAIPHYWLIDPLEASLVVMRATPDGYATVLQARRGELVRAEPFEQIELTVGVLLGDDPPEP